MTLLGIGPPGDFPPGCWGPPELSRPDALLDLQLMLDPLAALAGVSFDPAPETLCRLPDEVTATVELQLDADRPHLDFFGQLCGLLQRLAATPGVRLASRERRALASLLQTVRRAPVAR